MLYRPQNLATPYLNLTLKAEGTASFAEEVALPAGPYKLEIATANEWGKGSKSSMTAEFTVGEALEGQGHGESVCCPIALYWCNGALHIGLSLSLPACCLDRRSYLKRAKDCGHQWRCQRRAAQCVATGHPGR